MLAGSVLTLLVDRRESTVLNKINFSLVYQFIQVMALTFQKEMGSFIHFPSARTCTQQYVGGGWRVKGRKLFIFLTVLLKYGSFSPKIGKTPIPVILILKKFRGRLSTRKEVRPKWLDH